MTSSSTTETHELLRDAFEAIDEGMAIFNAERQLLFFNERYAETLEQAAAVLQPGLAWEDLLHACAQHGVYAKPDGHEFEWKAHAKAQSEGTRIDVVIQQSGDKYIRVGHNPTPTGGFVVTRNDITEEYLAETRIRESEELLALVLDTNPSAIVMARAADSKIIYRSRAARELFGDTTYGKQHFVREDDRLDYYYALKERGQLDDFRVTLKGCDGREFSGSLAGRLTEYNGQSVVVTTSTDLSERRERDAMIQKVITSVPAPILMTRASSGEILFKSPEIDALFGPTMSTRDFYVNPDDRKGFLDALRRDGSVADYRVRVRDANGAPFFGAVSARLIEYNDEEVIVSYSRDLTQEIETEKEISRQREQLFQTEKMSAIGGLLAGVAHELNNPLSVVVGHALMLQEAATDPETIRQTERIRDAAERCAKTVKTFLTIARQEPANLSETDVNAVIKIAVDLARFGDGGVTSTVHLDLDQQLPTISADADQITQVIANLLLNAEQAGRETGEGRIEIRSRPAPGEGVRIVVEDNGPGVPADIRARVFEPFFTTKGVGEGTGIGLTHAHRVITAHGGSISIDAGFRAGARFVIDLPSGYPADPGLQEASPRTQSSTAALHVLVIDDEPDVADLNAEVLERGGYAVTTAYSAATAIEALRKVRFDAIVSDLNMPEIDGRGFFETVQRDFPEMLPHTGFVTGDTMGRASQTFLSEVQRPYIEKPVAPDELREFVDSLLKKEHPS